MFSSGQVPSQLSSLAKSYSFLEAAQAHCTSPPALRDHSRMPSCKHCYLCPKVVVHSVSKPFMLVLFPQRCCKLLGGKDGPFFPLYPPQWWLQCCPWQVLIIITRWVSRRALYHIHLLNYTWMPAGLKMWKTTLLFLLFWAILLLKYRISQNFFF